MGLVGRNILKISKMSKLRRNSEKSLLLRNVSAIFKFELPKLQNQKSRSFCSKPMDNNHLWLSYDKKIVANSEQEQNIIPIALLNDSTSSNKFLLIPLNFSNNSESLPRAFEALSFIQNNFKEFQKYALETPTNTNVGQIKDFDTLVENGENQIEDLHLLTSADEQIAEVDNSVAMLEEPSNNEPAYGASDSLAESETVEDASNDQVEIVSEEQQADVENISSQPQVIEDGTMDVELPEYLENNLQKSPISGMHLEFELEMPNINEALLNIDHSTISNDIVTKSLKDASIHLTTDVQVLPKVTSQVPVNFNALIKGTVDIDRDKYPDGLPALEFNDMVAKIATNICGAALQQRFENKLPLASFVIEPGQYMDCKAYKNSIEEAKKRKAAKSGKDKKTLCKVCPPKQPATKCQPALKASDDEKCPMPCMPPKCPQKEKPKKDPEIPSPCPPPKETPKPCLPPKCPPQGPDKPADCPGVKKASSQPNAKKCGNLKGSKSQTSCGSKQSKNKSSCGAKKSEKPKCKTTSVTKPCPDEWNMPTKPNCPKKPQENKKPACPEKKSTSKCAPKKLPKCGQKTEAPKITECSKKDATKKPNCASICKPKKCTSKSEVKECKPKKCEPKKCQPKKCEPKKCQPKKCEPKKCPSKAEVKKCEPKKCPSKPEIKKCASKSSQKKCEPKKCSSSTKKEPKPCASASKTNCPQKCKSKQKVPICKKEEAKNKTKCPGKK